MKKVLFGLVLASFLTGGISLITAAAEEKADAKAAAKAPVCYVCDKCHTVAMQPGKCSACGNEMKAKNLLAIKDGMGYFCNCKPGCKCTMKDDNASECSCGKPITKASLKGMYICNCGPACKCNMVSDKPGKCYCGSDLKKVE